MRDKGVAKGAISNYKGALQLRNWLAHGRHWHPKLGRAYSPNDVFDISSALISSIPRD